MRQPRTFSERLALLNRLNRRQVEETDDDEDSDDDEVAGLEDAVDSASESGDDDDDISSTDGDIEEGDPAVSPDPGAALPPSAPPGAVEPPAASPTDPPAVLPAPVKSDPPPPAPTTSAKPTPPEASTSTTSAKPEPTGIVNNPAEPAPSSQEELSTTAQVISQITSAAGAEPTESASPSEVAPIVSNTPEASNSLVLGGQNGSPTASGTAAAETTSGGAEAVESGGGGGGQAMSTGASVGITFGALAGLGLMVTVGLALYKWRKRHNAAVYDRPAPPGVYTSDEKQAAVMDAAMRAVYNDDGNEEPGRLYSEHNVSRQEPEGAYQKVTSWIKDTANRVSERTEWAFGPSQEPTFVRAEAPAREPTDAPVAGQVAEPIREPARAAKRATTMTTMTGSLLPLAALAALASAHGLVEAPVARSPGAATAAACGQNMVKFYTDDPTSYPEALFRGAGWDQGYNPELCNHYLCKGFQFEDNAENVQTYAAGDVVDFEVFIRIPHVGYANVSVVDLASNSVIGDALKVWESGYADGAKFPNLPADQTAFSVTIPELGEQCAEPGACALQWYWFGQGQTYESCVDFVVPAAAEPEE
ncbi:uncharacterized protein DNG_02983 [Cephalotrichum gorgonifer]|uniref:Chitin-binding type-4 domain-containing protein n=1 Tax=Cephalotrichum gorgonifer TaxID=2041049 RepID=A0AAE8ST55_9PEZI|nr:uncharacterized protein DNG_02983 [Cephalotrichum gorgonifer]